MLENNIKEIDNNLEARENLVEFFELLLKIDMRINPDNYKFEELDKSGHKEYSKNISKIK